MKNIIKFAAGVMAALFFAGTVMGTAVVAEAKTNGFDAENATFVSGLAGVDASGNDLSVALYEEDGKQFAVIKSGEICSVCDYTMKDISIKGYHDAREYDFGGSKTYFFADDTSRYILTEDDSLYVVKDIDSAQAQMLTE